MSYCSSIDKLPSVLVVLPQIRSTHNVGSIFRSCDGFGSGLVMCGITPTPRRDSDDRLPHVIENTTLKIKKTALGAEEMVNWTYFKDFNTAVSELKKAGYKVFAIEQNKSSENIRMLTDDSLVALVMGEEREGLTEEQLKLCDAVYEIPMVGSKESLNVSVATAVALYQVSL